MADDTQLKVTGASAAQNKTEAQNASQKANQEKQAAESADYDTGDARAARQDILNPNLHYGTTEEAQMLAENAPEGGEGQPGTGSASSNFLPPETPGFDNNGNDGSGLDDQGLGDTGDAGSQIGQSGTQAFQGLANIPGQFDNDTNAFDVAGPGLADAVAPAGPPNGGGGTPPTPEEPQAGNSDIGPVTDSNASTNAVAENSSVGTTVGLTGLAADPDDGDTVTYALTDNAGGLFSIDASTGVVKVAGNLDHETDDSHQIEITATSSDGSTSVQTFTIGVSDENEPI
ncbi:MAG: cadherin repeat domain-containing protein, partial [Cohaesibacteraceae bacterium]|nr:cadherin repeat domain-containing protein [Cohaesibacteraceae bacterium]